MILFITIALLTFVIGAASLLWFLHHRQMNYFKTQGFIHEKPHWLFGNCEGIGVTKHFLHIYREYYEKFKNKAPAAGFYLFFKASVLILDLDLANKILVKDFQNFPGRGFFYNEERDPLSAHLFSIEGERWKKLRSKMTQAFTSGKMKIMFPAVVEIGNQYVRALTKTLADGSYIDIKDWNIRYMVDVIGSMMLGIDCQSLADPSAEIRVKLSKLFLNKKITNPIDGFIMGYPDISKKLNLKITPQAIEDFLIQVITDTVNYRRSKATKAKDFLSILMNLSSTDENGNEVPSLTDLQIATEAHIILFAGFESSSSLMSFALYELAKHPELQEKLRQEINSVLNLHGNQFSYESMTEMVYLTMVIKETLRMYPLLHEICRVAINDYKIEGTDLVIEKGTRVVVPLAAIHRDSDIYEDPDTFNPERFFPEEIQKRHQLAFLAFGEGPRSCVAFRFGLMQAKLGLIMLLRHFSFSFCEHTTTSMQINLQSYITTSAEGIILDVKVLKNVI